MKALLCDALVFVAAMSFLMLSAVAATAINSGDLLENYQSHMLGFLVFSAIRTKSKSQGVKS